MAIFGKKKETTEKTAKEAAPAKSMQELYAEKAPSKTAVKAKSKVKVGSRSYRLLLKPLVTEKTAELNSLHKYVFVVAADANKITVAEAVAELYGVKPLKVNLLNMSGKMKTRGRITGQRKNWRKAIVTLPAGAKLDVYEGV
jgi:large subunit ribosomal protein L23